MLNHDPYWKYWMLFFFIFIGFFYALPNLYGEDPAVQITGVRGIEANANTLNKVREILFKETIPSKLITIKNGSILVRFSDPVFQLHAREVLIKELGNKYSIALNLFPATPKWLSTLGADPIKLGLDLRGGIHFLMEVDINTALSNLQKQKIDNVCSNLRKQNIPYLSVIQQNHKNMYYDFFIRFPDSKLRDKAIRYLSSRHSDLIVKTSSNNQLKALISDELLRQESKYTLQKNITILRNRVNRLGVSEPLVQQQGIDRIVVELPGIQDTERAKEILGATASLELRLYNTNIVPRNADIRYIPVDSEVKFTNEGHPVVLYKKVILTGDHITDSTFSMDEYNRAQVNIVLDNTGAKIMSNFTKDHIGKPMATLFIEYKDSGKKTVNGKTIFFKKEEVINIATIQSQLGKNFRITNIANPIEARQLSFLLRSGALIAPIKIIEEKTIGPTLGAKNLTQGLSACLCSLISSIIFMVIYYRKFGLIASSALLINLVLIIGVMSLLPGATLTMPGIAGIVLTLAVAVDANVLINERIKEEIRNGRSIQQAIHQGYEGAFSSIVDANVTTLITAIILYAIGTSSIKGFAISTIIGVITSMFTAIVGTRAIVNLLYGGKRINKLSI